MAGIGDGLLMATAEERRILYKAVKRLTDEVRMSFEEVYASALGHPLHRGAGYQDNFRAGRIDRKLALAIYDWLHAARPDYGELVDYEIELLYQSHPGKMGWETLLTVYGVFGYLSLDAGIRMGIPAMITLGREDAEPVGEWLSLRERFTLTVDSPCSGVAFAVQTAHGRWFPLPLALSSPSVEMTIGKNGPFPRTEHAPRTEKPPYLMEASEPGLRRMAVLIVPPTLGPALAGMLRPGLAVPKIVLDDAATPLAGSRPVVSATIKCHVRYDEGPPAIGAGASR